MNKKNLVTAIAVLALALEREVETKDLDVSDLEKLHAELTNEVKVKEEKQKKEKPVFLEFTRPYKRYANGDTAKFEAKAAELILNLKPAVAKVKGSEEAEEE